MAIITTPLEQLDEGPGDMHILWKNLVQITINPQQFVVIQSHGVYLSRNNPVGKAHELYDEVVKSPSMAFLLHGKQKV